MRDESLMTAARAAGFALAADESADWAHPRSATAHRTTPKDVLAPVLTRDLGPSAPSAGMLQRALAATTLPNWVAGKA